MTGKLYYKDGTEVKDGDILFYSEDDGNNKWHYANSIVQVTEWAGTLYASHIFYTQDDGYTLLPMYADQPSAISIYAVDNVLQDFIKIGTKDNPNLFDKDYINKNYARKNIQL